MYLPHHLYSKINRNAPHAHHVATLPTREALAQFSIVVLLGLAVLCVLLSQCYWEAKMMGHEVKAQGKKK